MTYILRLTSEPAVEPVSLAEAKEQCNQDQASDDALISRLIKAARQYVETETGRALVNQTWEAVFGEWPRIYGIDNDDEYSLTVPASRPVPHIEIIKLPFGAVTGITADGTAWTAYTAIKTARGVRIKPTSATPSGEIIVTFTAGYGASAANVPSDICHAILMLVATLYDNRGALALDIAGIKAASVSVPGFADTIHRHRVMS